MRLRYGLIVCVFAIYFFIKSLSVNAEEPETIARGSADYLSEYASIRYDTSKGLV